MSTEKTYYVHRAVIQHGPWYLKRGDKVPSEVPAALTAAWLKAKSIGPDQPK